MSKVAAGAGTAGAAVLVIAVLGVILALPVMWLWNWLMPQIFGLPEITFLQALGLFVLANLLTRGLPEITFLQACRRHRPSALD